MAELLDLAGKSNVILEELLPLKLTYGAIEGSDVGAGTSGATVAGTGTSERSARPAITSATAPSTTKPTTTLPATTTTTTLPPTTTTVPPTSTTSASTASCTTRPRAPARSRRASTRPS